MYNTACYVFSADVSIKFRKHSLPPSPCSKVKVKGRAITVYDWTDHEGSRRLRLPAFQTITYEGAKVSFKRRSALLPQEIFLVLISVRD
jgi:hypothetical protein